MSRNIGSMGSVRDPYSCVGAAMPIQVGRGQGPMRIHWLVSVSIAALSALAIDLAARSAPANAFIGARLFDGSARPPIEDATIVVRAGRITAIGPSTHVQIPADANRISLAGKTII